MGAAVARLSGCLSSPSALGARLDWFLTVTDQVVVALRAPAALEAGLVAPAEEQVDIDAEKYERSYQAEENDQWAAQ